MKVIAGVVLLVAAVSAGVIPGPVLLRTPSLDSAVIKSDRIGGNFAYSSVEGHAYTAINPVVQHVPAPVAVSYSATPIVQNVARITPPVIAPLAPVAHVSHVAHVAPLAPVAPIAAHSPVIVA